jgi:lipid-A-disaccharide synthase
MLARLLVKVRHVALPNILLNEAVYPEFIQGRLQTEPVCQAIAAIVADEGRKQLTQLAGLRSMLEGAADEEIAEVALRLASGGQGSSALKARPFES